MSEISKRKRKNKQNKRWPAEAEVSEEYRNNWQSPKSENTP